MASITRTARSDWKTTKARCIDKAAIITDLWDIVKAWLGHFAVIILFLCMVGDILQVLPVDIMSVGWKAFILGVQIVTIDIAGFGLQTMAENARTNGDIRGYKAATRTSSVLIGIMIVTLLLLTMGLIWRGLMPFVNASNDVLILVRVVMTVLYGHIVHSLSKTHQTTITPSVVESYEAQLEKYRQQLEHQAHQSMLDRQLFETRIIELHTQHKVTIEEVIQKRLTVVTSTVQHAVEHDVERSLNTVEHAALNVEQDVEHVERLTLNVEQSVEHDVEHRVEHPDVLLSVTPINQECSTPLVKHVEHDVERLTLTVEQCQRIDEALNNGVPTRDMCKVTGISARKYKEVSAYIKALNVER